MLRQFLLAALLLALLSAQNPIESTAPEDVSTTDDDGETTTTEMMSTEDISSTYDSDSDSESEESEEGSSSSDISSTDSSDSGSDDDSDEESDDTDSSSDSDNVNTVSAEDDNDTDDNADVFGVEGEDNGDDGRALDSESDDQDSSDSDSDDVSSTEQGDDDEEEDADTEFDDAGDDNDDDVCLGLDSSECGNTFGDDGMQLCGYNTNTDDCFEVVMTVGQRGRGSFDDGYTMAQGEMDEQASQLYTVIGILGGLVGLLVLTVMGGAYYIYSNKKQFDYGHSAVPVDIIDIDGGRTTTRGQHARLESHSYRHSADITPMLDTM